MAARALGRLVDFGVGVVPVDMNSGDGATGKRCSLAGADGVDIVVFLGAAASGSDDVTIDVQQHTAYTSGTSNDLDATGVSTSIGITEYYYKSEVALDNDEGWTRVTQAAASEVTLAGASFADKQMVVVIPVRTSQLGTDYTHISATISYATNAVRVGAMLYLLHGLRFGRRPDKLGNLLRPGAANA